MRKGFLAVALAGLLAAGGAALVTTAGSAATAPSVTCGPGQTLSGTYQNVLVPSTDNGSNFCNIQGATILGTLTVQSGGAVVIGSGSTINNISSTGAGEGFGNPLGLGSSFDFSFIMCNSTVNGRMTVSGSSSAVIIGDDDAGCGGNTLNGPVTVSNNRGGVEIVANTVNNNMSVTGNSGQVDSVLDPDAVSGETTDVSNNSDGSFALSCSGNAPVVVSSGNTFARFAGGQCHP